LARHDWYRRKHESSCLEEKFLRNALLRIRSAAKGYEESNQRLDIKACYNIAHKVSSKTEINWEDSIKAYKEL
tara:strand:+ start:3550 stop:3768 length:219 start_codon:yes stop_codon:yes gene_type:complete